MTTHELNGKKVAFLLTHGVEQVELTQPWSAVKDAGGTPVLVAPAAGTITAMKQDWEHAETFAVDLELAGADAAEFDALVLPGGTLNADSLRVAAGAPDLVRAFFDAGKPVAAICHGPWILIDAGVAAGRTLTSYVSLAPDLRNAGATWVDEQVVVDGGLTTSRNPGDLDAFCAKLVDQIA